MSGGLEFAYELFLYKGRSILTSKSHRMDLIFKYDHYDYSYLINMDSPALGQSCAMVIK